jgi:hypothetical protein
MYTLDTITLGESWACKFTTTTFVDAGGRALRASLSPGEPHPGTPQEYTSVGVIRKRDTESQLVEVVDVASELTFVVPWSNCTDIDRVEWTDEPINTRHRHYTSTGLDTPTSP